MNMKYYLIYDNLSLKLMMTIAVRSIRHQPRNFNDTNFIAKYRFMVSIRPLQFNYLSYMLRSQEMSHFGIKKKLKNVTFFIF